MRIMTVFTGLGASKARPGQGMPRQTPAAAGGPTPSLAVRNPAPQTKCASVETGDHVGLGTTHMVLTLWRMLQFDQLPCVVSATSLPWQNRLPGACRKAA